MKIFKIFLMLFCFMLLSTNVLAVDRDSFRPSTTITNGQVSCGTTATLITNAQTSRTHMIISTTGTTVVYIGGGSVTTANGLPLVAPTGGMSLLNVSSDVHPFKGALYCIVGAGTQTIGYMTFSW